MNYEFESMKICERLAGRATMQHYGILEFVWEKKVNPKFKKRRRGSTSMVVSDSAKRCI